VAHSRPNLIGVDAHVLTTEGNIVTDRLQDDLIFGVLKNEPDFASAITRFPAIDGQLTGGYTLVFTQDTGHRSQQSAFA
jgi:hypothetical protein